MKEENEVPTTLTNTKQFVRVPGLFRAWEVEEILTSAPGSDYYIKEGVGGDSDGSALFAVYRRDPRNRQHEGGKINL